MKTMKMDLLSDASKAMHSYKCTEDVKIDENKYSKIVTDHYQSN